MNEMVYIRRPAWLLVDSRRPVNEALCKSCSMLSWPKGSAARDPVSLHCQPHPQDSRPCRGSWAPRRPVQSPGVAALWLPRSPSQARSGQVLTYTKSSAVRGRFPHPRSRPPSVLTAKCVFSASLLEGPTNQGM